MTALHSREEQAHENTRIDSCVARCIRARCRGEREVEKQLPLCKAARDEKRKARRRSLRPQPGGRSQALVASIIAEHATITRGGDPYAWRIRLSSGDDHTEASLRPVGRKCDGSEWRPESPLVQQCTIRIERNRDVVISVVRPSRTFRARETSSSGPRGRTIRGAASFPFSRASKIRVALCPKRR